MRIGVFTGSRANYSSTKTILANLQNEPAVELISIVGGAATLSRYGAIHKAMENDGLKKPDYTFNMFIDGESTTDMAKSCGLGLMEMSSILGNANLDFLVVVGDRYDVMSAVIAAAYMNIPIVHTMGGEVTGTIDESIRHAITKFAHVHLVANQDAFERVKKLGEDPNFIFNVGCPRLDIVKSAIENDYLTNDYFYKKYAGVGAHIDLDRDFLLVSYHPVTTEINDMRFQVDNLLSALQHFQLPTIMLWPNFDAGSSLISKSIRTFRELYKPDWLNIQTNLSVEDYSILMNRAMCLVGNSSSGIREGAFIGTPVVNIGSRQNSRLHGRNVIQSDNDKESIVYAIEQQTKHGKYPKDLLYGDGNTGERIINVLRNLSDLKIQKIITY